MGRIKQHTASRAGDAESCDDAGRLGITLQCQLADVFFTGRNGRNDSFVQAQVTCNVTLLHEGENYYK